MNQQTNPTETYSLLARYAVVNLAAKVWGIQESQKI